MKEFIIKKRDIILLTIGILLIVFSLGLLFYDRIEMIKSNIFAEVEMEKYRENNDEPLSTDDDDEEEEVDDAGIDDMNIDQDNLPKEPSENTKTKIRKEYIGYLEIKKINLKQGFLSKNSRYNHVNYNIQLLGPSNYPDKELGNTIIAGHSGNSYLGYFKNLYKLKLGDEAKITYKGYIYNYKIVNIYNVPKTGKVKVVRDYKKTCLTLITCTYKSKTQQTVYILELTSKEKDGGNSEV